eukprot:TRINITY_DN45968_c0_g1_i1.p1 TRINITY_DN45968_c0_g1~~TRINITY_DN45968_c0_g1_i1.p1  ORF type:complete len:195 (+),score=36.56 TRINITY_DN45968_c0_g1_i1:85-669(+)
MLLSQQLRRLGACSLRSLPRKAWSSSLGARRRSSFWSGPPGSGSNAGPQGAGMGSQHQLAAGATSLAVWLAALSFARSDLKEDTTEITVQELVRDYVAKGRVQQIQIVNKSVCLVQLHDGPGLDAPGACETRTLSVQLDGLEKFERKLEELQERLGWDRDAYVNVQYIRRNEDKQKALLSLMVMLPFAAALSLS